MNAAIPLLLLAMHGASAQAPVPRATERTGVRLTERRVLKLELASGFLLDSNPTNASLSDSARLFKGEWQTASPGVGVFIRPSLELNQTRRRYSVALRAAARAWGTTYAAPAVPTWRDSVSPTLEAPGGMWPQSRAAVDASVEGAFTWNTRRSGQLTSSVALLRTNIPTAEQLGMVAGRTTLALTQSWSRASRRSTWTTSFNGGARADVFDNLSLDPSLWRMPSRGWQPPISVGGGGVFAGAGLERRLNARHVVYGRGQLSTATYVGDGELLSLSLPLSAVAGWFAELRRGTTMRLEGGVWLPDAICPSPVMTTCATPLRASAPRWSGDVRQPPDLVAWMPQPVGSFQLDQAVGRRWLLGFRLSKDGRSTPLYSFVDEKRLELSATGQLDRAWQVRMTSSVGWLSYGDPVDSSLSRNKIPWPAVAAAPSALQRVGRQDLQTGLDGTVRWTVAPWLILSAQQSLLLLLTTTETRSWDGSWSNPGLARAVTSGSLTLLW